MTGTTLWIWCLPATLCWSCAIIPRTKMSGLERSRFATPLPAPFVLNSALRTRRTGSGALRRWQYTKKADWCTLPTHSTTPSRCSPPRRWPVCPTVWKERRGTRSSRQRDPRGSVLAHVLRRRRRKKMAWSRRTNRSRARRISRAVRRRRLRRGRPALRLRKRGPTNPGPEPAGRTATPGDSRARLHEAKGHLRRRTGAFVLPRGTGLQIFQLHLPVFTEYRAAQPVHLCPLSRFDMIAA
mmetsp:Transcript_36646/g.113399  ORF Transcript_36646/g.113399 Transcript_36646/m.113399 type:complete len:240 (-) Transcript_36646:328-1047(-)